MKVKFQNIYFFAFPTVIFVVTRCLGFDGLYGQDSYEYFRYANEIQNALKLNTVPGDYFWPLYYPLIGALLNSVLNNMILTLSLISVFSVMITSIYIHKTLNLIYKDTSYSYPYVTSCFIISPSVTLFGLVVMSDMLSLCFLTLSIYYSLKFNKTTQIKHLYFTSILAISAIMTRYACFVILLPFAILVGRTLYFNLKKALHLIPISVVIFILILPHIFIRNDNVSEFLQHNWLKQWSVLNFFKIDFNTIDGISSYMLPNIVYAFYNLFHPKFLVIGVILILPFALKKVKVVNNYYILISYLLYSLFLAGIPFQNTRFLILNFGLAIILLFPCFQFCATIIKKLNLKRALFLILILLQLGLSTLLFKSFYLRNQLERNIATKVKRYQNNTLYSFDIDVSLIGRGLNFDYKNMWSNQYDTFKDNSLVLFNPQKFEKQWRNKNPMINWRNIKANYNLKILEKLDEGWVLYNIESKK